MKKIFSLRLNEMYVQQQEIRLLSVVSVNVQCSHPNFIVCVQRMPDDRRTYFKPGGAATLAERVAYEANEYCVRSNILGLDS